LQNIFKSTGFATDFQKMKKSFCPIFRKCCLFS